MVSSRKIPGRKLLRPVLVLSFSFCLGAFSRQQSAPPPPTAHAALPSGPGWHELPNTQLAPLCPHDPAIAGNTGCRSVIAAWNSATADEKRDRLILWGGGHSDYFGNELYALDLNTLAMSRLTDPSPVTNVMTCPEAYVDGKPSSRHTYGGLAFIADRDAMFAFGGSKSACGSMTNAMWILDLATFDWRRVETSSADAPAANPGAMADYDPASATVLFTDRTNLFRYDPAKNKFARLSPLSGIDYHLNAIIDPVRGLFLMIGGPGQFWAIDIRPHSAFFLQDWSRKVTGCDPLRSSPSPGLAYDSESQRIVGWAGGDSIYLFDPASRTCSVETYPGGPGPAQPGGTFGRFRYFPRLGVFALVNDWKKNAFILRLAHESKPVAPSAPHGNNQ